MLKKVEQCTDEEIKSYVCKCVKNKCFNCQYYKKRLIPLDFNWFKCTFNIKKYRRTMKRYGNEIEVEG